MKFGTFFLATSLASASLSAAAQQSQEPRASSQATQMHMGSLDLPEACKSAAQDGGHSQMMQGSNMAMMQNMQGMMSSMSEAQKAYMDGMNKTNLPMMQGMMVKDPDVAWACSMIPHHMGAIEMSNVVLKYGDNAEIKKMAQKAIDDQGKEISVLKEWLQKNANRSK